jgi:hydrogenase maturation protein HypF
MEVQGAVQGVGFRPFVHRLATELSLAGWVANDARGVVVEAEADRSRLDTFLERLSSELPAPAVVEEQVVQWLDPVGYDGFAIRRSDPGGAKVAQLLPDVATCHACLRDLLDPDDRRYRYPFTNCTHCGPRLSIIRSLPYDRPRTTMRDFTMCADCRAEYEDPADRRFHAQPNACPACGPRLAFWNSDREILHEGATALEVTAIALRTSRIVAVKGLGGFHLMVDARDGEAVARLRAMKPRREKPLALMVRDAGEARRLCEVDETAAAVLNSPEAPIVLLPRRPDAAVHDAVAPGNPYLGLMLPYTPLHHLLMHSVDFPVVATSGNLSEEPICTDEHEAVERLGSIADAFLVHDRPIARHVDDSVVTILDGEAQIIRRARGYAPRPVLLRGDVPTILAVGGHFKNAIALSAGRRVFVSQHVGDMETPEALAAFERVIDDFLHLYEARPVAVAHDLHPDYPSTRWAHEAAGRGEALRDARLIAVQHHHAHLAACLAEHGIDGPALGVTWDGTGYGPDATVWGGEFLCGTALAFRRVARLRSFRLPGGELAVREPRRSAIAMAWEIFGDAVFERDDLEPVRSFRPAERRVLARMLERGVNAPQTTSAGRLFDGVAALVGLHQSTSFEGQAAMALEHIADPDESTAYPVEVAGDPAIVDWCPLLRALLEDLDRKVPAAVIAARFHNALAGTIVRIAREVGQTRVALTGGCFQNRRLTRQAKRGLLGAGFDVLLHRQVPPNDGGIALGQIAVAAAQLRNETD